MEKPQAGLNQARDKEEEKACVCWAAGWCVITNHKCPYEGIEEHCPLLLEITRNPE